MDGLLVLAVVVLLEALVLFLLQEVVPQAYQVAASTVELEVPHSTLAA